MKIDLTCPRCNQQNTYSDREYNPDEEFLADVQDERGNMVVCKDCGFNFEFFIKIEQIEDGSPGLWPRLD